MSGSAFLPPISSLGDFHRDSERELSIIILLFVIFSFLMYLFDRLSPYSYHNNKEKYKDDDEKREFTLKECLWFCMTVSVAQCLTQRCARGYSQNTHLRIFLGNKPYTPLGVIYLAHVCSDTMFVK